MTLFCRWTNKNSPDMANYRKGTFSWTFNGVRSRKAFRLFRLDSDHKPNKTMQKHRILLAFDRGARVIEDTVDNRIDSGAGNGLKGETAHPMKVIGKQNERGAFGTGASPLEFLQPREIRLTTRNEIGKALGIGELEVATVPTWPVGMAPPPARNLPGQLLHR